MTRQFKMLRALSLAAVLVSGLDLEQAIAAPYSIDILIDPNHPGLVDSWLFDINDQGQSTGYVVEHVGTSFVHSAVIYRDGATQLLASGGSGNPYGHAGFAINNLGDVVGNLDFQPNYFGAGGPTQPIEIPGKYASSQVGGLTSGGLNDSGSALITAYPNDPVDTPPNAFSGLALWNLEGTQTLDALDPLYPYLNPPDPNDFNSGPSSGAYTESATRLNNANQFAAVVQGFDFNPMDPENFDDDVFTESFAHAYIYDGQSGYSFLEESTPGEEIRPIDIDEAGTVLGWAGDQLALWGPDGALQSVLPDPGTPLDDFGYQQFPTVQRNNLGQVVAVTIDGGVLFYDPVSSDWTDVTPSIHGLGTGTFSTIQGFNDLGQFVGLVRPPQGGGVFGYVVSPVPEPGTLVICGIGLLIASGMRRCESSAMRTCAVANQVLLPSFYTRRKRAMTQAIACVAALAICLGGVQESNAGAIDVSYAVSGSPGNYDLNFSVTNNMLAWPTQNVYFFGVRLSVSNITGSPVPFADRHAGWNFFNYGGSATELNNTWQLAPFAPASGAVVPGTTRSGFIVHIPDLVAPSAVSWGAISYGSDPYTGGGNFISQGNPGFEGLATPAVVPEPASLLLAVFAVVGGMIHGGHRGRDFLVWQRVIHPIH